MKISKASIALLVVQLALVSLIAAKYMYQRVACPRVWVRTVAYDPETVMRGRYLSLQLTVDGCQSTLPSAALAKMPHDKNGLPVGPTFFVGGNRQATEFQATLKVEDNKLKAIQLREGEDERHGQTVNAWKDASCDQMSLQAPVDFYIAEHAANPLPLRNGQEFWIEVTVPPQGPPRPLQLALKQDGSWKPLAF
jgi:uncharacterized membrane-anchored protein